MRVIKMKQDTKQLITQPKRNNSFRKIVLDIYDCKRIMVAGTENLIMEYCMTTDKKKEAVLQGREGRKPLWQDKKATLEGLA